jgi:hypothetical protein
MTGILLMIWQLPQTILAVVLMFVYRHRLTRVSIIPIVHKICFNLHESVKIPGISVGNFIFIREDILKQDKWVDAHEYGHSIQSLIFGPLYLIVIGLPSLVMNVLSIISIKHFSGKFYRNYYRRWPESWADRLAGVDREGYNGI